MFDPEKALYESASIAEHFKALGMIDDETAVGLECVPTARTLKILALSMASSHKASKMMPRPSPEYIQCIAEKQLAALQYISEVLSFQDPS